MLILIVLLFTDKANVHRYQYEFMIEKNINYSDSQKFLLKHVVQIRIYFFLIQMYGIVGEQKQTFNISKFSKFN